MNNEKTKRSMLNDEQLTLVTGGSEDAATPIPVVIKYACMKGCGAEFDTPEERDEHEKTCQYGPLMKPIIF